MSRTPPPTPEVESPGLTPVVITLVVGIVGVGLVVLATAYGWLGPDVDRGAQFCETAHWCFFAQPANTVSNVAFIVAAAALAWGARRPSWQLDPPALTTPFTVIVALLGPASMAMHATESALGGHLDVLSMHLIAAFAAVYALARLTGASAALVVVAFVGVVVLATVLSVNGGPLPVLHHTGNLVFAVLLLVAVVGEAVLWRRLEPPRPRWGIASLGTLLVAFLVWVPSQTGGIWCVPESWLQGHALWHVLCAAAAYLLGRHYVSAARRLRSG